MGFTRLLSFQGFRTLKWLMMQIVELWVLEMTFLLPSMEFFYCDMYTRLPYMYRVDGIWGSLEFCFSWALENWKMNGANHWIMSWKEEFFNAMYGKKFLLWHTIKRWDGGLYSKANNKDEIGESLPSCHVHSDRTSRLMGEVGGSSTIFISMVAHFAIRTAI